MADKVRLCIPTYNATVHFGTVDAIFQASKAGLVAGYAIDNGSSLVQCFNRLWFGTLDARSKHGITHFAMLHADILPESLWLDKMMAIMKREGADVLSAISPMKSHHGLTTTGLDTADEWSVRRFTMKQLCEMPPTFTHPKLVVNTGLMLVDLSKPWVDTICFNFLHGVVTKDGKRQPVSISEDFLFSRDAAKRGAKLFATREVALEHVGTTAFTNRTAWGTLDFDVYNGPAEWSGDTKA